MNERAGPGRGDTQLHAALLQYAQTPGKYQLTLRQPALLFQSIREILQLAAGRTAGEAAAPIAADLQEAAGFFLRAALLYPGADHYAVLGLPPRSEPVELKERYRLLMRLIHPDYAAAGAVPWPADAAVRVNRAYEVLSSPTLRGEYDEQLAGAAAKAPVEAGPRPFASPRRTPAPAPGWTFNRKAAGVVLAGSAALFALALLMPAPVPGHLVQRAPRPAAAPVEPAPTASIAPPAQAQPEPPAAPAPPRAEPARPTVAAAVLAPGPAAAAALPHPPVAPPAPAVAASRGKEEEAAPIQAALLPAPPSRAVAVPPPPAPRPPEAKIALPEPALPVLPPGAPASPAATHAVALAARPIPAEPPAAQLVLSKATVTPAAVTMPAPPAPTLADAQPLLTQLLQLLESGSGEQLLHLLEAEGRDDPAAQALSRHYEQLVRGGRPVRLSHVDFRGEPRDGALLVTGRIRLHAGEPTIGSFGELIVVRAEFASRGGRVTLTRLAGGAD